MFFYNSWCWEQNSFCGGLSVLSSDSTAALKTSIYPRKYHPKKLATGFQSLRFQYHFQSDLLCKTLEGRWWSRNKKSMPHHNWMDCFNIKNSIFFHARDSAPETVLPIKAHCLNICAGPDWGLLQRKGAFPLPPFLFAPEHHRLDLQ